MGCNGHLCGSNEIRMKSECTERVRGRAERSGSAHFRATGGTGGGRMDVVPDIMAQKHIHHYGVFTQRLPTIIRICIYCQAIFFIVLAARTPCKVGGPHKA